MKVLFLLMVLVTTFGGMMVAGGVEKSLKIITGVIIPALPGETIIIMGTAICAFFGRQLAGCRKAHDEIFRLFSEAVRL